MEGTLAESGELAAYHKVWYSFTPEKAGRYSIKANGAQVYEYRNGTKGSGNWTSTPQEFFVTDEMVGKEIIYAVYHTDTAAKKKVSLSIAEVTAAEFGPEKPYTVDITKIEQARRYGFTLRRQMTEDIPLQPKIQVQFLQCSGIKHLRKAVMIQVNIGVQNMVFLQGKRII